MPLEPRSFPPNPIRDIEARYSKQTSCGGYAAVTVDFEPGPGAGRGFELAVPTDVRFVFGQTGDCDYRTVFAYLDALAGGIQEELAAEPRIRTDTRVILRRIITHEVDSSERTFGEAGRMAARAALKRAFGPPAARP